MQCDNPYKCRRRNSTESEEESDMEDTTILSPLLKLPTELKLKIMKKLRVVDMRACRLVCKQLLVVANDVLYFEPVLSNTTIQAVVNCQHYFTRIWVSNFDEPMSRRMSLKNSKQILSVSFISSVVSQKNIIWLLRQCTEITNLVMVDDSLSVIYRPSSFKSLVLNKLTQLVVLFEWDCHKGIAAILGMYFPSLKCISISNTVDWMCWDIKEMEVGQTLYTYPKYLYQSFVKFVVNHSDTLKHIKTDIFGAANPQDTKPNNMYPVNRSIIDRFGEVKLEELDLIRYDRVVYPGTYLRLLLDAQDSMTRMALYFTWYILDYEYAAMKRNYRTLKELKVDCRFYRKYNCPFENAYMQKFNCEHLENCNAMTMLEIRNVYGIANCPFLPSSLTNLEVTELVSFPFNSNEDEEDQLFEFVGKLQNLESLILTEEKADYSSMSYKDPAVTLRIFCILFGLPKLKHLSLAPVDMNPVESLCRRTPGVTFKSQKSFKQITVNIDRDVYKKM